MAEDAREGESARETIDTSSPDGEKVTQLSSQGSQENIDSADGNVNTTFSVRSAEERQRFMDELDNRIHSDPEVYTPVWQKMRERVRSIQDAVDALTRANEGSVTPALLDKYREQGLIEINAVINSLPKSIRAEFIRNWRSPYSGEAGNIFTKYSSLGSSKERTDFLLKTIMKAKSALDDAMVKEYSTRHQILLDKAQPKGGAGEIPKGKLGADVHKLLDEIQKVSDMDLSERDPYIQGLQAQKDALENGDQGSPDRQAKIDALDQQIWIAGTHGGMSMTDSEGRLKTAELRRSDVMQMGAAVDELKQIIKDGRFDFNAQKNERSDRFKGLRQEVIDIVNGGKKGTPSAITAAKDKSSSAGATTSKRVDDWLLPAQLFRQILKNSPLANEWGQRITKAQNEEADSNIKFQHDAMSTLREAWGKNGKKPSLVDALKVIAGLSNTLKETGIMIRPNKVYKTTVIDRNDLGKYHSEEAISDREFENIVRMLSDDDSFKEGTSKKKISKVTIHEITDLGDEEELKLSPLQFVDALLAADQPDAAAKCERNGLTPEVTEKIRDLVNKSQARDIYDLAKKAYDQYDRINAVFRNLYGVDLPRVDSYAPLTFDHNDESKIIDPEDGQAGGASSQPSWAKSRGSFGGKLRYDNAWAKMQNHVMNVNYWLK